ncbi:peptidylprolyl isomerase [Tsukamurella sp. PLM1]|uniref:peptidylprolyl isomerase n=1 Tax=Tsukamurella sp. PLM1 TaxID=2929795 RepID=UPI002064C60B|nr:peptidylprolyl isomerase [Tsukamurella sp. PLM1]BDH57218.1 putative peptidyl-prolyl cis-trans isomerase [Tsukamurella sp. PLM1]
MPSNEERRQAAREKLAKQNERREADARKRKIKAGAVAGVVVVALVAAGCYIWLPQGPRAPLRVGAEDRFRSLHVTCDFKDRPDQVAAARKSIDDMKKQIAQAKTQLAALNAEQKTALQEQITTAEARNAETEKMIPQLEKISERNKGVTKPGGVDVPNTGTLTGSITTNQGVIGFELDRSKAPCNVETFVTLMQAKYFDNTICHRETASESPDKKSGLYVLQCGDPSGTGLGGPNWTSPDEAPTFLKAADGAATQPGASPNVIYPAGTIAVANANNAQSGTSNTGSSQFFLVYKDTTLPADYSVIGKTDDAGLTVLQQVAKKGIKAKASTAPKPGQPVTDGEPMQPVTITSMALAQ